MIQVPGWVVVAVMVIHAMVAVFNERIEAFSPEPWVGAVISAVLVGLNVLSNAIKPLTEAIRSLGR